MRRIMLLALALLCLLPGLRPAGAAESIDLGEVVRTLEEPFKTSASPPAAISDFQADFTQESLIASLDRAQRGKGKVLVKFDRRGERIPLTRFRWEYVQPAPQEIVSDGRTLWVYLPENQQVIQTEVDLSNTSRPDDPVTFLTGLGNLSRDFSIAWAEPARDEAGNYVLELRPKKPSPVLQRLLVVVDRAAVLARDRKGGGPFPIRSTTVFDPSDNRTTIRFDNVKVNRGIPDSTFKFTVPEGVEVVRPNGGGMGF